MDAVVNALQDKHLAQLVGKLTDLHVDTLIRKMTDQHVDGLVQKMDDRLLLKLIKLFQREHIDVLAHRLTEPLQRMIRAEMRTNRERAGRLRDGWR
ncbi:hypothetical protein [Actinoplanes sp. NPDC051494]|uniref:hypothetical protein n=1 Tax=Actinoplanes sp. NPDC051494 TaxID=3363907 RepID=UPI003795C7EF